MVLIVVVDVSELELLKVVDSSVNVVVSNEDVVTGTVVKIDVVVGGLVP